VTFTREDVELYMMGEFDGDKTALEAALAEDPNLRAIVAEEAQLEMLLRDAAADAVFCVGCGDLASEGRGERGRVEDGAGEGAAERARAPSQISDRCAACGVAVKPGGYVVERVLVSNAHGRMYVARDADGTQVALKELAFVQTPALDTIAMFEREAKFLRALEHPAIPRFVASFEEGTGVHTRYYLAQELVTGESLDKRLEDHFFTEAEILDLARQVLAVLVYLQSLSPMVIHRDIKPANLIAKPDGKIAVVDFGAAHVQGTTAGSTSIGTFGYMPIEQLAGQVDSTTDVYALGASLIHLLSRREPWRLLQGASLEGINVSHPLRDFLTKIVATEPSQRFASASAAVDALDKVTRGERLVPIAKPRRTWARPALLAAAAFGCAAGGFGIHHLAVPAGYQPPGKGQVMVNFTRASETTLFVDNVKYGKVSSGFTVDVEEGPRFIRLTPGCTELVDVEAGEVSPMFCDIEPKDLLVGTLRIEIHGGSRYGLLVVDGQEVGNSIWHEGDIDLPSGRRTFRVVAKDNTFCEQTVDLEPGKTTTARCTFAGAPDKRPQVNPTPHDPIPPGKSIDLDFKDTSLHDVIRTLGEVCNVSAVVPDHVDARITINLKKAPCDQALEVLLESHGLWYRYSKVGNLILIAPRNALDRAAEHRAQRLHHNMLDDELPDGPALDLDFKAAPLHDLLRLFADTAGVNIVVPHHVDARVTLKLKKTPWKVALATMLEAHGLWYRYRPNGKLLRVAPRNEIDRELERDLQRPK
jgi:hypothetical protein